MNKSKIILFRCDGSKSLGLGHLVRSLSLAAQLVKDHDSEIMFAVREDETGREYVQKKGFNLVAVDHPSDSEENFIQSSLAEANPDILLLDGKYQYEAEDILKWKESCKIVIIDDNCPGMHAADLVIFPITHISTEIINLYKWGENGVAELVYGNKYVILSENILKLSKKDETNITNTNNIIITTGGSDPEGVMITLLKWFINEPVEANITALIGDAFMHSDKLDSLIRSLPENLKVVPFSYEELLKADLVVTTFGITLYELFYLGLPAICIAHSTDNSIDASILKERCDCFEDLGYIKKLESAEFISLIKKLIKGQKETAKLSELGSSLIDGKGVERVAEKIIILLE